MRIGHAYEKFQYFYVFLLSKKQYAQVRLKVQYLRACLKCIKKETVNDKMYSLQFGSGKEVMTAMLQLVGMSWCPLPIVSFR